jgi:hypothetical protein
MGGALGAGLLSGLGQGMQRAQEQQADAEYKKIMMQKAKLDLDLAQQKQTALTKFTETGDPKHLIQAGVPAKDAYMASLFLPMMIQGQGQDPRLTEGMNNPPQQQVTFPGSMTGLPTAAREMLHKELGIGEFGMAGPNVPNVTDPNTGGRATATRDKMGNVTGYMPMVPSHIEWAKDPNIPGVEIQWADGRPTGVVRRGEQQYEVVDQVQPDQSVRKVYMPKQPTGTLPGNISMPGQAPIATFVSPQAGAEAAYNQVRLDQQRTPNMTLSQVLTKYTPPQYNDTQSYIRNVSSTLGINPNTPISSIDTNDLVRAISRQENVSPNKNNPTGLVAAGQPGLAMTGGGNGPGIQTKPAQTDVYLNAPVEDKNSLWVDPFTLKTANPDQTPKELLSKKYKLLSTASKATIDATKSVVSIIDKVESMLPDVFGPRPAQPTTGINATIERATTGVGRMIGAAAQTDPKAALLKGFIAGTLAPTIRSLGEKGTLATEDVARAAKLMADMTDTSYMAYERTDQLKKLFAEIKDKTLGIQGRKELQGNMYILLDDNWYKVK